MIVEKIRKKSVTSGQRSPAAARACRCPRLPLPAPAAARACRCPRLPGENHPDMLDATGMEEAWPEVLSS
jgi:hypothetical protein